MRNDWLDSSRAKRRHVNRFWKKLGNCFMPLRLWASRKLPLCKKAAKTHLEFMCLFHVVLNKEGKTQTNANNIIILCTWQILWVEKLRKSDFVEVKISSKLSAQAFSILQNVAKQRSLNFEKSWNVRGESGNDKSKLLFFSFRSHHDLNQIWMSLQFSVCHFKTCYVHFFFSYFMFSKLFTFQTMLMTIFQAYEKSIKKSILAEESLTKKNSDRF